MAICFSCKSAAYLVDMTNILVQEVPEYPRREHIFCLTTPKGEAFLFQVRNQWHLLAVYSRDLLKSCRGFQAASEAELESWQHAIHISAAMQMSGGSNRELISRTLRKEMEKIEEKIESVRKVVVVVVVHVQNDWGLHNTVGAGHQYFAKLRLTNLPTH